MRLKTSFRERKINRSFQQYGPHFLRFRDQNAGGENAEIVESFINFIIANMRQTTHPYPRVLWMQARQIEYEYNIFLVKMNRQKEKKKRHRSFSSPSYSEPTEVSLLSWMGVAEFCSLHHWVAWIDCSWGCWDVPVCSPLKADFFSSETLLEIHPGLWEWSPAPEKEMKTLLLFMGKILVSLESGIELNNFFFLFPSLLKFLLPHV